VGKTILIADDNPIVLKEICRVLETQPGYSVCAAVSDGRDAVAKACELKPDLIILDLSMPVMNGLEAANAIKQHSPSVPIVLFTVHNTRFLKSQALASGVRAVISKDESMKSLIELTRSLLYSDIQAVEWYPAN
jgi:two-component system, NarL family, nitrate/nitrite response regulator NarL